MNSTSKDPDVLIGLSAPDDAAVFRVAPDVAIVQTVDFFTPIVDDPFAWGRIAAANALSDIYAMGARPRIALNLIGWPRSLDFAILGRVLDGAAEACDEAEISVVGGHSVDDPEPKYGLAVTGTIHPEQIVRKQPSASPADLVLTKPLGMGIIATGIKEQKTSPETVEEAQAIMGTLNRGAAEAMLEVGALGATDVTGFGLVGHLREMLGGQFEAELEFASIPVVAEAFDLVRQGAWPGGSQRNFESFREDVDAPGIDEAQSKVIFDAQTSGGLLIAVDPHKTETLQTALKERGVAHAARIGRLSAGKGRITVV